MSSLRILLMVASALTKCGAYLELHDHVGNHPAPLLERALGVYFSLRGCVHDICFVKFRCT